MEELGLAQGAVQDKPMQDLNQIVAMLMQGMTPEQLVQKGVPEALVMAALEMVAQQSQVQPEEAGLANMVTRPV